MLKPEKKVAGGSNYIGFDFPDMALTAIEKSYEAAKTTSANFIPIMKQESALVPLLATAFQPLTNQEWETTLPNTVRLVFTSVWNILVWLLHRRKNNEGESVICVAVNKGADALMIEKIYTVLELEAILNEYQTELRIDRDRNNSIFNDSLAATAAHLVIYLRSRQTKFRPTSGIAARFCLVA